jgi:hypothetical protein
MPARKVQAKGGSLWDDVKDAWANDRAKSTNAQLARIDAAVKGGGFWDDVRAIYAPAKAEPVKAEPVKAEATGAGLKKTSAKGRKGKKELVAHEVLLKELLKVKEPVKSQRRANKKQTALRIEDFVSKSKPKDQVTQLLEGIRIKRALDAQYKKMSDKANEKLKKDILDSTTKSKDREVSDRIKAEDLKVITDKRDAELLVLDEAKYQKQLRRDRILDAQKERRQLLLEDGRDQQRELAQNQRQRDIERRQNLLEDARDIRRDNVQDLRQRDIEAREEVKYQDRQMLMDIRPPRGRPIGAYSTVSTIDADDGSYSETAYKKVSKDSVILDAIKAGVSAKGKKEAIARRIVNSKSGKEEADELFEDLETLANMEHRPTVMITPDLLGLGGAKLKGVDDEGVLPKVASAPTAKALPLGKPSKTSFLADLTAGLGKKLKKSTSGLLDTTAADTAEAAHKADQAEALAELDRRPKASRANKGYAVETVDGMLAELTHRKIEIPSRTKLAYVKGNPIQQDIPLSEYKQLLFELMKNSYRK